MVAAVTLSAARPVGVGARSLLFTGVAAGIVGRGPSARFNSLGQIPDPEPLLPEFKKSFENFTVF